MKFGDDHYSQFNCTTTILLNKYLIWPIAYTKEAASRSRFTLYLLEREIASLIWLCAVAGEWRCWRGTIAKLAMGTGFLSGRRWDLDATPKSSRAFFQHDYL
jgi:hypothetical protein